MIRTIVAAALAFALHIGPVLAQRDHHDHSKPGPHGGQVLEVGPWHAELVAKGEIIQLHMSGGDQAPIPATGFAGTAILVSEGKSFRVALAPEGDRLVGTLPKGFKGRPKGAIRLVGPGGATASVKIE